MKTIDIHCKINNLNNSLNWDNNTTKKTILGELNKNLENLLHFIPEYQIKRTYQLDKRHKIERSVIIKFPYGEILEFYNSRKKNYLLQISCTVENNEKGDDVYNRVAHNYFQLFLYDLFISLNIASPGSFEIYNWRFLHYKEEQLPQLHSFYFNMARNILYNEMNTVIDIPIEKIISRVNNFYKSHDDLPNESIIKSLNTLLHLSIETRDRFSPETGLLITYALESLLGGSIPRSLLFKRLCLILDVKEPNKINKLLKAIYDWRNKIVHGEYKLPHPGIYDVSNEFDSVYSEYLNIIINGFALVLSLIQILIKNNSISYLFEENISFLK